MTTTLISGATRGLGLEAARRLVAAGHDVYVGARDLDRGRAIASEIGATAVELDVTDDRSVRAAAAALRGSSPHLDVLVNNAGIAGDQDSPGKATIPDLERVLATNVVGAARLIAACTPLLEGSAAPIVVNVSSAVGSLTLNAAPDAPWSALGYPMSKAALNMLTIQYARAFPRWRVNSVTPGLTNTDFIPRDVGASVGEAVEIIVRMASTQGEGPSGTFQDINGLLPW
ncbi:MAG TPA: SDR family NAD(P)-dependent oxidoreductase [Nocardioides sp.]|jgi:NAD(P)-dependent dehydrogenase (short-subunit alcohol dehydrogenase family)|uniref:SDR family NAD(P)-dependent oxidoreductase n=1 Tax=Nocardioides sp. TaxID=35761 RepID=UPI002E3589B9|nr:SDR family NAD(P)-dependent oxidoreductase [Nocardioides sp.]HEX3930104.1 SDR family NAD(P)-dependent oxidoreductase [Nocardioides sp.]